MTIHNRILAKLTEINELVIELDNNSDLFEEDKIVLRKKIEAKETELGVLQKERKQFDK